MNNLWMLSYLLRYDTFTVSLMDIWQCVLGMVLRLAEARIDMKGDRQWNTNE